VKVGTVKSFAIWNPIDLGYSAVQIAARLARGEIAGPNSKLAIGRMGEVSFGPDGTGPMSKPFVYDKSNVEQFAKIF
jgi:rhamnose transport system substrate-binding protein